MATNLRKKTVTSLLWTSFEKFGMMGMAFVSNLILARLLMPEDFGAIGMLNIFIAISGAFMIGGLSSAIIQKKNVTDKDLSTVFIWNMVVSLVCYLLLFLLAPSIAKYYNIDILKDVLRVYGITLLLVAVSVVQQAWMQKQLQFKELAIRNLVSSFIGLIVGIVMAFKGFAVWSLVFSNLTQQFVASVMIWGISKWRPKMVFDKTSFKELFSFGGMMLLTSLVDRIYRNIQGLLIGKYYTASDLGMYNQAKKLEDVPNGSMSYIVSKVTFPVFSKLQDNKDQLLSALRKNLIATTYLNFPLIVLLMIIAKPLILLLYGEKWLFAVPYFQLLSLGGLLYTLNSINSNIVKSLGKGRLFLITDVIIKIVGFVLLVVGVRINVYGVLIATVVMQYVTYMIFSIINNKLINYGFLQQLKDVLGSLLLTVVIGLIVYWLGTIIPLSQYIVMLIQIFLFMALYLVMSKLIGLKAYKLLMEVLDDFRKGKKNK
jgi:O-antigen/teichoic acid export membrane protein